MVRSSATTPAPMIKPNYTRSVWMHDWYTPEDSEISKLVKSNKKLKGWHRILSDGGNQEIAVNDKCVLNLNGMKYYEEVPIVDHSKQKQLENEAKASENEITNMDSKEDLSNGLSVKVEGEIDIPQSGIV